MWPEIVHEGKKIKVVSAHEIRPQLAIAAKHWMRRFKGGSAGSKAIKALDTLQSRRPSHFNRLKYWVLFDCWCALQYQQNGGHPYNEAWSSNLDRARRDVPKLAKATEKWRSQLEVFVRDHEPRANVLIGQAFQDAEGYPRPQNDGAEFLINLMREIQSQLDRKVPVMRLWIACLNYGRPILGSYAPPDEARTGLEFALVSRFRHFTDSLEHDPMDIVDRPMPDGGNPYYKIVARLTKATFDGKPYPLSNRGLDTDAEAIGKRVSGMINRNPGMSYSGWPVRR